MVTNITRFGAFVDIGVKQDGLVHVSEIANRYITDPNEVLKLNDKVQVKVMEVDLVRKRIALSIKQAQEMPEKKRNVSGRPESKKPEPSSSGSMADALNALKKKFGN
jgi:protein Tex